MTTPIRVSGMAGRDDSRTTIQATLTALLDEVESAKRDYEGIRHQVKRNLTLLFQELAREEVFALLGERVNVLGNRQAQGIFLKTGERGLVLTNHDKKITVYVSAGPTPDSACEGEVSLDYLVDVFGDSEIVNLIGKRATQRVKELKRLTDGHKQWGQTLGQLAPALFPASK